MGCSSSTDTGGPSSSRPYPKQQVANGIICHKSFPSIINYFSII